MKFAKQMFRLREGWDRVCGCLGRDDADENKVLQHSRGSADLGFANSAGGRHIQATSLGTIKSFVVQINAGRIRDATRRPKELFAYSWYWV